MTAPPHALSAEALAEIERKAKAATDGPWSVSQFDGIFSAKRSDHERPLGYVYGPAMAETSPLGRETLATCAYIAALSPDVALAMVAEIGRLRTALEEIADCHIPGDDGGGSTHWRRLNRVHEIAVAALEPRP